MSVPSKETHLRRAVPIALTNGYPCTKTCFPYSFSIDKLILTLKPSVKEDPNSLNAFINTLPQREGFIQASEEITLSVNHHVVEKYYNFMYLVYYKGKLVADLATGMRLKTADRDFSKLTFHNYVHYEEAPIWYLVFNALLKALPLQLNNIKYLELALDANQDFIRQFGGRYNYSTLNLDCKPEHLQYSPLIKDTKVTSFEGGKSFYIGDKKRKQISIYSKTEDVINKHKEYIFEFWKRHGVKKDKGQRVELKMTEKYLGKLEIEIEDLTNSGFLLTLFKKGIGNNLSFNNLSSKYYDKNRNYHMEVIHLLPLDQLEVREPIEIPQKKSSTAITTGEYRKVRQTVKTLTEAFILNGNETHYFTIQALGREAGIANLNELVSRYATTYRPETLAAETFQRIEKLKAIDCIKVSASQTGSKDPVLDYLLNSEYLTEYICENSSELMNYVTKKFSESNLIKKQLKTL